MADDNSSSTPGPELSALKSELLAQIEELRAESKNSKAALLADVRRLRSRLKKAGLPESEPEGGDKPVSGPSAKGLESADIAAAIRYGELRAALPASARADLDSLDGASFQEKVRHAELLSKYAAVNAAPNPAGPSDSGPKLPPGKAATAAPLHAPKAEPSSIRELLKIQREDPEHFKQLMDPSSTFDPSSLR